MLSIRHVLSPTDFSTFSERSLRYATLLAKWSGADLTCFFVLGGPLAPLRDVSSVWEPITGDPAAMEKLEDRLLKFAEPAAQAGIPVKPRVLKGEPSAVILEEARRVPESLVVIGTHGRSGFENLVLGSVAEKVLRKASCPVLTVPREPEESPAASIPFERIVVGIDFSRSSELAFETALDFAQASSAAVTAVHVVREVPEAEAPEMVHFNVPEYRRLLEREARSRLVAFVAGRDRPALRIETRILAGKPWRRLLQLAHETRADLVVLGVQGRSTADLLLFGSTAHHLVRTAPCPVLTVRPA